MKILLLEDEPLVAISLMKLVHELEPAAQIEGPVASVSEAELWFREQSPPDLILSDIQLSDGISLDLFTNADISVPIIFTTAYNEYAIRAFKLNSIDYLLKPIDKQELANSLRKFHLIQSKFGNEQYLDSIRSLFSNFSKPHKFKERFAVHLGRSVTLVPQDDVCMFVKEELIYLLGKDAKKYICDYRSLDEVEELLDPARFFRANRQHIVHLPLIESYRSDDTGKIYVKMRAVKRDEVIVSKERASEFRKWFE